MPSQSGEAVFTVTKRRVPEDEDEDSDEYEDEEDEEDEKLQPVQPVERLSKKEKRKRKREAELAASGACNSNLCDLNLIIEYKLWLLTLSGAEIVEDASNVAEREELLDQRQQQRQLEREEKERATAKLKTKVSKVVSLHL